MPPMTIRVVTCITLSTMSNNTGKLHHPLLGKAKKFYPNFPHFSIDATAETGKLGRLVNHSRNGNLLTKTVMVGNRPHLVLIAKDDLEKGVELTYDYGDRSKEALQHHPWLAL